MNEFNAQSMPGGDLANVSGQPATVPLESGGIDPLTGMPYGSASDGGAYTAPGSKNKRNAMMLLVLLAVAAGTLYAMRLTGGVDTVDQSLVEAEAKVDAALKRLTGSKGTAGDSDSIKDPEQVIALFADDPTQNQISLEEVQKNPFDLFVPVGSEPTTATAQPVVDQEAIRRAKELQAEFGKFKLQSILKGATNLAMVSGQVVRAGDQLGSFTVTTITPTAVELSADGSTFTLSMEDPKAR